MLVNQLHRGAVEMLRDLGLEAASTFEADRAEQSRAFDQLILAYLEKRPDQRPSTADTLAARLAGIEAAGSWSQHLARQWWDEHHPRTRQ